MNRRGLGGAYRRGETWWIRYFHDGKQYRGSSNSRSESRATALLKRRLGEIEGGHFIGPTGERITFEALIDDLVTDYKINTRRSLPSALGYVKHLRAFFGLYKARAITTDAIRKYAKGRQDEGASNGSINRELALLKRAFRLSVKAGRLRFAPHIPMLAEAPPRQGFLNHGDFLALRAELPEHLCDLIAFLYLSGWRRNEARLLGWREVDLPSKIIRLHPERSKNG